ncbi:hypothetical protein [Streptomyces sp. NPDC088794]|uniref:hypothetical protein n=1 Tax=Streptomyces sp. NPDC088794 TaxID=3365902 RepID=UPI0037FA5680
MAETSLAEEVVGRFWATEPTALSVPLPGWLLVTEDEAVAVTVARLYDARRRSPRLSANDRELLLSAERIPILLDEGSYVVTRLILGDDIDPAHVCDGTTFLDPMAQTGEPCGCPGSLADRRAAARSGSGPKPDVKLCFRLTEAPEIGMFLFTSSSWPFFESVRRAVSDRANTKSVKWTMRLQRNVLTTRSGMTVRFTFPLVS